MLYRTLLAVGLANLCASSAIEGTSDSGPAPPCTVSVSVANGGFEAGSLSPWSTVNGTQPPSNAAVVSRADGSGHAAQLNVVANSTARSGSISIAQLVSLCPVNNYSITFDYNPVSVSGSCELSVGAQSGYSLRQHAITSGPLATTGGWQTATMYYPNYVRDAVYVVASLQCTNGGDAATAQVDNFRVASVGSLEVDGCPDRPLSMPNGGFETGDLPPWKFSPPIPKRSVVSPGYKSNYALQIAVPSVSRYYNAVMQHWVRDDTCLGYNYTFSFAVNWGNYSFFPNKPGHGCYLLVVPNHCSQRTGGGPSYFPPPANSGWHVMSYSCIAGNSERLHTAVEVNCVAPLQDGSSPLPAFDLMLDSFTVQRAS